MQSDACHFSQTFLIRTDTRGTVPSVHIEVYVQRYKLYKVWYFGIKETAIIESHLWKASSVPIPCAFLALVFAIFAHYYLRAYNRLNKEESEKSFPIVKSPLDCLVGSHNYWIGIYPLNWIYIHTFWPIKAVSGFLFVNAFHIKATDPIPQ